MPFDAEYLKSFDLQLELLKKLREEVDKAISRAEERRKKLEKGLDPDEDDGG